MPRPYYDNHTAKEVQKIIRVNHAGEFGARRIYEGQIAWTKSIDDRTIIKHMLNQELEHLKYFEDQIKHGHARPTLLIPVWNILGYLIGAMSAKYNNKLAMNITENVERVIIEHYEEQMNFLQSVSQVSQLCTNISKFRQDELNHIHIALENNSSDIPMYSIVSKLIRILCKAAISISKKI